MKKRIIKIGLLISLILTLVAGAVIGVNFSILNMGNQNAEKVYAVDSTKTTIDGKDYSALWDGDVIFSVDKVRVAVELTEESNGYYPKKESNGYYYTSNTQLNKTFYGINGTTNNVPFYFDDTQREVVDNGGFIKLNNSLNAANQLSHGSVTYNDKTIVVQEAVIVSLGQYIYNNNSVDMVTGSTYAGISINGLNVTATLNGRTISDNFAYRNIVDGADIYGDFVLLIPESDDTEGFYQFDVNYMIGGTAYSNHFEFYVVFNSSYNKIVEAEHNSSLTYSTNPNLGWYQSGTTYTFNEKSEPSELDSNGFFPYYIGIDGISNIDSTKSATSFPTVTYDYTRFKLTYTYKTATKSISYDYSFDFNAVQTNINGNYINAPLVVTDSLGNSETHNMKNYHGTSGTNIVSIVFTEPGQYVLNFEYLYIGASGTQVQKIEEFEDIVKRFEIFGASLKYSKYGYLDAEMSYYQIANNSEISDLIVNGGKKNSSSFGFDYEFDTESDLSENLKVGTILPNKNVNESFKTQSGLINSQIYNLTEDDKVFDFDGGNLNLSKLDEKYFVKTNQGSAWISSNDTFTTSSKYYYGKTLEELKESEKASYTSMVSFNKTGYYVVCLQINTGVKVNSIEQKFWQIFAFKYSTTTIDIKVQTDETTPITIGAGKFTDKNVKVNWVEPDVFEWKVQGYYYELIDNDSIVASNYSREQIIQTQTKNPLTNGETVLGENVDNNYAVYVIKLERIGSSATYLMFTIDRSPITGVQGYVVDTRKVGSSTQYYYYLRNSNYLRINNYITDSYATIDWNTKESGADITATYSYLEFVKDETKDVENEKTISGRKATLTKYKIGGLTGPLTLEKQSSRDNLSYSSVLFNQGIYFFNLTDTAGNSIKYMLIIDKTETFIQIDDGIVASYHSQDYSMFTSNVQYKVSDYKAIELQIENDNLKNEINKIIAGNLETKNSYYTGNVAGLQNLFFTTNGDNYLLVRNTGIVEYDETAAVRFTTKLNFSNSIASDENETVEKVVYVVSANNTYSSIVKNLNMPSQSRSYVTIRVNKDQSQGMVYYTDSISGVQIGNIPTNGENSAPLYNLRTSSSIDGVSATSARYVLFTFKLGTDTTDYKVKDVYYSVYKLNQDEYSDSTYFYKGDGTRTYIYENFANSAGTNVSADRAFAFLTNGQNSQEGLYVVTRVYQNGEAQEYYFIVDRQGIISGDIGSEIKINLLESESSYNNFNAGTTAYQSYESLLTSNDNTETKNAVVYLKTSKLPATISVPAGKYFDGTNYSSYNAGKLNVNLYFVDTDAQIGNRNVTHPLFVSNQLDPYTISNGYISLDLKDYFEKTNQIGNNYETYGIVENNNGSWLCLPGVYVVEIYDNVYSEGVLGSNSITFAFKIQTANGPEVQVNTGSDENKTTLPTSDGVKYLATNDNYVSLEMPKYIATENGFAQVDDRYLIVKRNFDGQETTWIDYQKENSSSAYVKIWNSNDQIFTEEDDKISIKLDAEISSPTQKLYYEITIRYRLWKDDSAIDKYKDCYFYYGEFNGGIGQITRYYESTVRIEIDRLAPTTNVDNLYRNDNLVKDYTEIKANSQNATNPLFEHSSFEDGGKTIYSYIYNSYYLNNEKDRSKLYAFKVNAQTDFDPTDVSILRTRLLNAGNLTLSTIVQSYNYQTIKEPTSKNYSFLLDEGIYEILEYDNAGNMTQYLVYYSSKDSSLKMPVAVKGFENSQQNIVLGETINDVSMFEMTANRDVSFNDYFYNIELNKNGSTIDSIRTNLSTNFNDYKLTNNVIDMITNAGYGDYNLIIKTRDNYSNPYNLRINYYSGEDIDLLDIRELVVETANSKNIVLNGANKQIGSNFVYAQTISLTFNDTTTTYKCYTNDNSYRYYYETTENGETKLNFVENNIITCAKTDVYLIQMTDSLGRTQTYISGDNYQYVKFVDDNGNAQNYIINEGVYYGFNDAELHYSNSVFDSHQVTFVTKDNIAVDASYYTEEKTDNETIIKLKRYEDSVLTLQVKLKYKDREDTLTYDIVVDAKLPVVSLKDKSGISKEMKSKFDAKLDDTFVLNSTSFGTLTLSWSPDEEQTYYSYKYYLFEINKNGSINDPIDLTKETSTSVAASENGTGSFRFVVEVWTNEENSVLLGNKTYAFNVQTQSGQLYYVQDADYIIQSEAGEFTLKDLRDNNLLLNGIGTSEYSNNTKYPLYITYQSNPYTISLVDSQSTTLNGPYSITKPNYKFDVYKITTKTSNVIYVGILTLLDGEQDYSSPIETIKINEKTVDNSAGLIVVGVENSGVTVSAKMSEIGTGYFDYLTRKNAAIVDVYYNNSEEVLTSYTFNTTDGNFSFDVLGTGIYTFAFRDSAKRDQLFINGDNRLNVLILQEVAVTINDENVIENAIYNDEVILKVLHTPRYVIGTIAVSATKNGQQIALNGNNPYTFSEFGTYRVTVEAKYAESLDTEEKDYISLKKVVEFTIINSKEATETFDLTSVSNYKLLQVLNPTGIDKTTEFVNMMNSTNGSLITYSKLMTHADDLSLSSGKVSLTLTYLVEDGIYPNRTFSFVITLNNEKPTIECSLGYGEKTNKGFEIYFNPGIIYDKVGEAYIYINDRLVATINEQSAYENQSVSTTFKEFGAGDYYITLKSASGVIYTSYMVTITEPLNTWAIVLIVVAVVLVLTVTIVIIVLRTKMRIR